MATKATILEMIGEMKIAFQVINSLEELTGLIEESIESKKYLDLEAARQALAIYKSAIDRLGLSDSYSEFELAKFQNEATRPTITVVFQETLKDLRKRLKETMSRAFEIIERDKK